MTRKERNALVKWTKGLSDTELKTEYYMIVSVHKLKQCMNWAMI